MAGSKCAYLEQQIIDLLLGGESDSSFWPPATYYVALSTQPFNVDATGADMDEVSGGAYARVAVANSRSNFPASTGSDPATLSAGVPINFPTASADWGTVVSVYLVDAATNGNCFFGADLGASVAVASGSSISIPTGAFVFLET